MTPHNTTAKNMEKVKYVVKYSYQIKKPMMVYVKTKDAGLMTVSKHSAYHFNEKEANDIVDLLKSLRYTYVEKEPIFS